MAPQFITEEVRAASGHTGGFSRGEPQRQVSRGRRIVVDGRLGRGVEVVLK